MGATLPARELNVDRPHRDEVGCARAVPPTASFKFGLKQAVVRLREVMDDPRPSSNTFQFSRPLAIANIRSASLRPFWQVA